MSGKRYFLDTNALVLLGNGDLALHDRIVQIRRSRGGIKLPDAIVMASAQMTDSVLLTRDRQLLNSGLCEAQEF